MKVVIRAGGTGTRLWPMSRQAYPKQFQAIVGESSMIEVTYERILPLVTAASDVFVSVNQTNLAILKKTLPQISSDNIIIETESRNTGPAMCLEVCFLSTVCDETEVIVSVPSDDFISDAEAFGRLLKLSEGFLQDRSEYIVTPAVRPAYVDTGYSYFKAGESLASLGLEQIMEVAQVAEKPSEEDCQRFIASGEYYCHTGMYIWRLGYIKKLFKNLQPEMTKICEQIVVLMKDADKKEEIAKLYASLEKLSIESAITDKAPKLAMSISTSLGWSDLGKWHIIKRILLADTTKNLTKGRVITNNASNNLIYNANEKKVVVVNGLDDVIVVDTPEGLFISASTSSAEVKDCVAKIKENGWAEAL